MDKIEKLDNTFERLDKIEERGQNQKGSTKVDNIESKDKQHKQTIAHTSKHNKTQANTSKHKQT